MENHKNQIAKIQEIHLLELQNLRSDRELRERESKKRLVDMKKAYQGQVEELDNSHKEQMTETQDEAERNVNKLEKEIKEVKERHEKELDNLR